MVNVYATISKPYVFRKFYTRFRMRNQGLSSLDYHRAPDEFRKFQINGYTELSCLILQRSERQNVARYDVNVINLMITCSNNDGCKRVMFTCLRLTTRWQSAITRWQSVMREDGISPAGYRLR